MITLAIDPGISNGGVAYLKGKTVASGRLPTGVGEFQGFLKEIKEQDTVFCFLEKINAYVGDSAHPGKNIQIAKLLQHISMLQTVLKLEEIPYVLVPAITWQSTLNLINRKKKGEEKESNTDKKNRHKLLAQKYYPQIKVTHTISDALLILTFGKLKMDTDKQWVKNRLPKPVAKKLF